MVGMTWVQLLFSPESILQPALDRPRESGVTGAQAKLRQHRSYHVGNAR